MLALTCFRFDEEGVSDSTALMNAPTFTKWAVLSAMEGRPPAGWAAVDRADCLVGYGLVLLDTEPCTDDECAALRRQPNKQLVKSYGLKSR